MAQEGTIEFNFGDNPDPGVRSPKSGFTGLSIMLGFGGGLRSLRTSSVVCVFCLPVCVVFTLLCKRVNTRNGDGLVGVCFVHGS